MEITEVNIKSKVRGNEKENSRFRGIATVKLDDEFAVKGIRIYESDTGLHIAMPNRKGSDGVYRDQAHPINQECRKKFEDAIIEAYNNAPYDDEKEESKEE